MRSVEHASRVTRSFDWWYVPRRTSLGGSMLRYVTSLAVVLASSLVVLPAAADVRPGMKIDQSNADEVQSLLPPEIYEHYKKGEYTNAVVDFPDSKFQWDDGYEAATAHNRENLVLSPEKQPVDKTTGKRPDYITGQPFPDIKESDPDAG